MPAPPPQKIIPVRLSSGREIEFKLPREWERLGEDELGIKMRDALVEGGFEKAPLSSTDFMKGSAEVGANFLTYFPAMAASAVWGAATAGSSSKPEPPYWVEDKEFTPGDASDFIRGFTQSTNKLADLGLYYQPKTEAGKFLMGKIENFFHALQFGDSAGDAAFNITGSPAIAAASKAVGDAWMLFLPGVINRLPGMKKALDKRLDNIAADHAKQHGVDKIREVQVPLRVDPSVNWTARNAAPVSYTVDFLDVLADAGAVLHPGRKPGKDPKTGLRLVDELATLIENGGYDQITALALMKRKYNMSNKDAAALFKSTYSEYGRGLGKLGQIAKKLKESDPELYAFVQQLKKETDKMEPPGLGEVLMDVHQKGTSTLRMVVTSTPVTAIRNMTVSSAAMGIDAMSRAATAVIAGSTKGVAQRSWKPMAQEMGALVNSWKGYMFLSRKNKDRMRELLSDHHDWYFDFVFKGERLLNEQKARGTPASTLQTLLRKYTPHNRLAEVTGGFYNPGGIISTIHLFNSLQERLVIQTAMEVSMRQNLGIRGLKFETVKKVPDEVYKIAWEDALTQAFSRRPKTRAGKEFINAFGKIPVIGQTFLFPKFNFVNALPYVANRGPWTPLGLLSPKKRQELLKDPRKMAQMGVDTAIGTAIFSTALAMAYNMDKGQNWKEEKLYIGEGAENDSFVKDAMNWVITNGGKLFDASKNEIGIDKLNLESLPPGTYYFDATPFAPMSYYKGLAMALIAPEELSPADYLEIATGLARLRGTGVGLFSEAFSNENTNYVAELSKITMGNVMGGFAMPGRVARDLMAGWFPEEAVYRDMRQKPLLAPFFNNMPFLNKELAPKFSPLHNGPRINQWQRLRQFSGLTLKQKTNIELAVERLDLDFGILSPKTGVPVFDNTINMYHGELLSKMNADEYIGSAAFQKMPIVQQRQTLRQLMTNTRIGALGMLSAYNNKLYQEVIYADKLSPIYYEMYRDVYGEDLKEVVKRNMRLGLSTNPLGPQYPQPQGRRVTPNPAETVIFGP